MARGDERRAWQVLVNLLSNALKFSPLDSPVELRVVDTDTREVRFEVEDRGPGVAAEDQQRIFEKFSRARAATAGGEGTGLGLYIARSLASGQGGRIQVESELGQGSTFMFVLPKASDDVRPTESGELEGEPKRAGQRTLHAVQDPERRSSPRPDARGQRRRSVASVGARRREKP